MDIEAFVRAHPLAYVHIAYAVVWLLHFGYAASIVFDWRRTKFAERLLATEVLEAPTHADPTL